MLRFNDGQNINSENNSYSERYDEHRQTFKYFQIDMVLLDALHLVIYSIDYDI